MNCRDLEELLSAYADGELSKTQREFIEEHLTGCADCRETLAEFEAAGRQLSSLRETPVESDIRTATLSKIKATEALPDKPYRRWLRPALAITAVVAVIAVLLATQPWGMESPEAMAASIVRNSPEVQAALNGEEIAEIEVTTKIVDDEGNVLMMLVRTEERDLAAEVNLETKQVTEIVRVNIPDFQSGDEQKALDIAKDDPRVQELLAQGGVIGGVHLGHSIDIAQVTGPDGVTRKEGTVTPTVLLSIDLEGKEWNIAIDPHEGKVLSVAQSQPSAAMIVVHASRFATNIVAPILLVLGTLIIFGLAFGNRSAKAAAGISSLVLGVIGLFIGLYAMSSIWWRLVLIVGIPAVGLVIGITGIRQRVGGRRLAVSGIILCALALVWNLFHAIIVPDGYIGVIIGISVIIVGIIAYAFYDKIKKVSLKWLRPALGVTAAMIVLAILLITQPWGLSPQSVMAKAYAATTELQSYRMFSSIKSTLEGKTSEATFETEFVAPDRHRGKATTNGDWVEFIIIGDKQYIRDSDPSRTTSVGVSSSSILSKEDALEIIDSLTDLEKLPDEKIENVDCIHYRGTVDVGRVIEEQKAKLNPTQPHYEEMLKGLEDMRNMKTEVELWIGKEDYLIRQLRQDMEVPMEGTSRVTVKYYDFNEPITIEPPLDSDGQLLAGWELAGSITPDSKQPVFGRNITSSIGAQEGYQDWAHQEVKYSITITNNSIETVKNVRLTIATMLTDETNKPATMEVKPETSNDVIAPGESRTYHSRCPFDASDYTKEEILELQEVTTILVHFTTEDGKELTELLFPDAPYPTKKPPPTPPKRQESNSNEE